MSGLLLVCGVGGVGKTTLAAAMGLAHARAGRRVVVVTIDPARRLADLLGEAARGREPGPVDVPLPPGARLDALMLDPKATFDEAVRALAPDADTARRLLDNRYYRALSERLAGTPEYMALVQLHRLATDGRWDVVIVDTPPAADALDVFRAADRLLGVFDRAVVQALVRPRRGLARFVTRQGTAALARLVGGTVVTDIGEFFRLVAGLTDGFRSHAAAVSALLRSDRSGVWLVVDARAPERTDALAFLDAVSGVGTPLAGLLVNRVVDDPGVDPEIPSPPAPPDLPVGAWRAALDAIRAAAADERDAALAHRGAVSRLVARTGVPAWTVPDVPTAGLDGLLVLSTRLPPGSAVVAPPAVREIHPGQ